MFPDPFSHHPTEKDAQAEGVLTLQFRSDRHSLCVLLFGSETSEHLSASVHPDFQMIFIVVRGKRRTRRSVYSRVLLLLTASNPVNLPRQPIMFKKQ